MAVKKSQRWAIMVIMIVLVVGTLGSFAVIVLAQQSQTQAAAELQKASAAYTKEQKAYQAKVDARDSKLSEQYYPIFSQHFGQVGSFDIDSVKELSTEDLLVGDGEEITGTTAFSVYFIGWDANGNKFEGGNNVDFEKSKLGSPFAVADGLDKASLIDGWKEGLKGMRMGSVRLLTIPSDKAYKEAGSTDASGNVTIAPNMPLRFLVMAIPTPEEIPVPEALNAAMAAYLKAQTAAGGGY